MLASADAHSLPVARRTPNLFRFQSPLRDSAHCDTPCCYGNGDSNAP